jgi:hypothetical protein
MQQKRTWRHFIEALESKVLLSATDWTPARSAEVHQGHTLPAMRDTLLPRLISGEPRVKQAGKRVEEMA